MELQGIAERRRERGAFAEIPREGRIDVGRLVRVVEQAPSWGPGQALGRRDRLERLTVAAGARDAPIGGQGEIAFGAREGAAQDGAVVRTPAASTAPASSVVSASETPGGHSQNTCFFAVTAARASDARGPRADGDNDEIHIGMRDQRSGAVERAARPEAARAPEASGK
ncbi:hypothetical protein [Sorangium sp. So ce233]|uniref:hypothetical protein n=1 Tax=Sorangium sp. So ce233 TaxID=3133290 RepID=UPI003F613AE4